MSLTNPNTPVSQQDLQDFYHRILPYMGGMPEMLANKFSKGDLYSTEEKMIGQWIDGKPLYQKTFITNLPSATDWQTIANTVISDVDEIANVSGVCKYSTSQYQNIPAYESNYHYCFIIYDKLQGIRTNGNGWGLNGPARINVQYTKTTDSAISISSDTDYSTEEKIVGTWIDGKPVYQKTYDVNISADGSNGNLITTDTSISFVVNGCVVLEGGTDWILINDTIKKMKSDGKIYCWTPGMGGATIKYVTIQYTKTTD